MTAHISKIDCARPAKEKLLEHFRHVEVLKKWAEDLKRNKKNRLEWDLVGHAVIYITELKRGCATVIECEAKCTDWDCNKCKFPCLLQLERFTVIYAIGTG